MSRTTDDSLVSELDTRFERTVSDSYILFWDVGEVDFDIQTSEGPYDVLATAELGLSTIPVGLERIPIL